MKVVFVDSCISQRGENSRTRAVAEAFLSALRQKYPEAEIETVPVQTLLALRPFDAPALNRRDELFRAGAFEDGVYDLARQFQSAQAIVVAAPFWDLSFPAALRTYIEYICANGVTYHYDADGPHGDCKAAWLVYLTSGGDVERENSLGIAYWRQLCRMFGIPRFEAVFAGGLDLDPKDTAQRLEAGCQSARLLAGSL